MQDRGGSGAPGVQSALALLAFSVSLGSLTVAPGAEGLFGAFLGLLMLAIAVTDAGHYLIPNELTGAAFGLALLRAGIGAGAQGALWATFRAAAVAAPLLVLMLLYRRLRGRDGLGLGDVKLAAVCGAWLDLVTVVVVIELAALSAIAAYAINAALRRRPLKATAFLPFGLFLAPAVWIGWLGEILYSRWLELWPW